MLQKKLQANLKLFELGPSNYLPFLRQILRINDQFTYLNPLFPVCVAAPNIDNFHYITKVLLFILP